MELDKEEILKKFHPRDILYQILGYYHIVYHEYSEPISHLIKKKTISDLDIFWMYYDWVIFIINKYNLEKITSYRSGKLYGSVILDVVYSNNRKKWKLKKELVLYPEFLYPKVFDNCLDTIIWEYLSPDWMGKYVFEYCALAKISSKSDCDVYSELNSLDII